MITEDEGDFEADSEGEGECEACQEFGGKGTFSHRLTNITRLSVALLVHKNHICLHQNVETPSHSVEC
jgi:hypothetical protein